MKAKRINCEEGGVEISWRKRRRGRREENKKTIKRERKPFPKIGQTTVRGKSPLIFRMYFLNVSLKRGKTNEEHIEKEERTEGGRKRGKYVRKERGGKGKRRKKERKRTFSQKKKRENNC